MGAVERRQCSKMEALKMENLQKRYADETEEDKAKRRKQMLFPAFIMLGVSVVMLVFGVKHDNPDDCPGGEATRFLTVGGAVLLVSNALKLLAFLTPCECDDKISDIVTPMCDFAYFITCIWGSVLVFGVYSETTYDDKTSTHYCEKVPFSMAFYMLVFFWIFLPLACCCGAMACCCAIFAKCKGEENAA